MSGQQRLVNAEMARPKTPKGSALKSAMNTKTMESKILKVMGDEKQPIRKAKN